jgi:uncharacterized membrane protein
MDGSRILRHLATGSRLLQRRFPEPALRAIESAIHEGEARHAGELCFAVEAALDPLAVMRGLSPRERAIAVFSELRVWDTEQNSGVLIYVLLADRDVEIVADRGIHKRVEQGEWEAICRQMEGEFRAGRFESGALTGIRAVSELLARHFPPTGRTRNELPNRPVIL